MQHRSFRAARTLSLIVLMLSMVLPLFPTGRAIQAAELWQPLPRRSLPEPSMPQPIQPAMLFRVWLPMAMVQADQANLTPNGGEIVLDAGRIIVRVPSGAVTEPLTLQMSPPPMLPVIPTDRGSGVHFALTAHTASGQAVTNLVLPISLSVALDPPSGYALSDFGLFVAHHQTQSNETRRVDQDLAWQALPLVERSNGRITATTTQLGTFAALRPLNAPDDGPAPAPVPPPAPTPTPGCPAALDPEFEAAYQAARNAGETPGCPTEDAKLWDGVKSQAFERGVIVAGFYLGAGYLDGYRNAGGPGGSLGLPIEHSFQAAPAPPNYRDNNRSFIGSRIQYYERGFVGQEQGSQQWIGALHFPVICPVEARYSERIDRPEPDPSTPEIIPPGTRYFTYTITAQGFPAPGANDQASFNAFRLTSVIDGKAGAVEPMNLQEGVYTYHYSASRPETEAVPSFAFSLEAMRSGDGFAAYTPAITEPQQPLNAPGFWACPGGLNPGEGGYNPPRDMTPPKIAQPSLELDGEGGLFVKTTITDDRGVVADATVFIDDQPTPMQAAGGDQFTAVIKGLAVGPHTLRITARDPSGNEGRWPEDGSSLVFKIEHSFLHGKVEWVGYSPDPINTRIGNFIYEYIDTVLLGNGPRLELRRFYNSQSGMVGLFGLGWTTLLDMQLRFMDNPLLSGAQLRYPDGRTVNFAAEGSGFARAPYDLDRLERDGDGFVLIRPDGTRYRFQADGRLIRIEDRSQRAVELIYNGASLTEVRAPSGQTLRLTSDAAGRVTQVDGPDGLRLSYIYDEAGRLLSVMDGRGETVSYAYDDLGGMTQLTTPLGHDFMPEQRYDDRGRVVFQRVGENFINLFVYDDANQTTILTDTYGNTITYRYDEDGRLIELIDALGQSERFGYNEANQRTSYTDRTGATTTYGYDDAGNRISEQDALGNERSWIYDNEHKLLSSTDALGRTTTYEYDAQGRRTALIDPLGGRTELQYDAAGLLITQIGPDGARTSYTYNAAGHKLTETNPLGHTTRYSYDDQGRRTGIIDALGGGWSWTYDRNSNLLTETNPLGYTSRYAYNANNERISMTDALGRTTRYSYDRLGKLIQVTYPDGSTTTYTYDGMGNKIAEQDQLGFITRYELDALYRVVREFDPLGGVTSYSYDGEGRRISRTDANGATTRWEYDALGRQISELDALGGISRFTYDAVGNRLSESRPSGAATTYSYDALDQIIAQTDALGGVTRQEYDRAGNLVRRIDPRGVVTSYRYDAAGQLIAEDDALGFSTQFSYDALGRSIVTTDALGFRTQSGYDAVGQVLTQTDALGFSTLFQYDAVGQVLTQTDALGFSTEFSYDLLGRVLTTTDALGGVTRHSYDRAGRRESLTDANGHTTQYRYDALGRTITERDPLGFEIYFIYDAVGNLLERRDQEGQTTSFSYDLLRRKLYETNALGFRTSFAYDADSNLVHITDALGSVTSYSYDALGQRSSTTDALGRTTRYAYDAVGNQISAIYPDGVTNAAVYDYANRVIARTDGEGHVRQIAYDAVGNPVRMIDARGNLTETSFDGLRRPLEVRDTLGLRQRFTYDAVGNLIAEANGEDEVRRSEFDALRRPVAQLDAEGHRSLYTYDAVGNQLSVTDGAGGVTQLSYDARNHLVVRTDANGNPTRYRYDGVGRQISEIDPLGVITQQRYDAVGQLVAVTLNYNASALPNASTNVTTQYTYDAVGNRVTLTNPNGATIHFVPDAVGQLLSETDPLGNTIIYNYDRAGRQVERREPDGGWVQNSYDRNGRLIQLTYADGRIEQRAYDPDGNLIELRDPTGLTQTSYDARNRVVREVTSRGAVMLSYDLADRPQTLTFPDGRRQTMAYLANGWLRSVTLPDGRTTQTSYDGAGRMISESRDGAYTAQRYDAVGNLLHVETRRGDANGRLNVAASYSYDARNQRTTISYDYRDGNPRQVTETYRYDALRRVIAMEDSAGVQVRYAYDAAGNRTIWTTNDDPRTSKPFDALELRFSYDAADQLLRADDAQAKLTLSFAYDAMGRRIERRAGRDLTTYGYDGAGRVIAVQEAQVNGSGRVVPHELTTMNYDALGRRITRTVDNQVGGGGAKIRTYIYAGLDPIGYREDWRSQHVNLYRSGNGITAQERYTGGDNPQRYWLTQDGIGSTLGLARDDGQAAKNYRYDPYGLADVREFDSDTHISYLYTGQEYDESTGLYHFHARDYDPETATWLSRDPYRGTATDPQSLHRYAYVKGDPVNLWDVLGYSAQGGTYGKPSKPSVDPLVELIFGTQFARSREIKFSLDSFLKKPLGSLPVPERLSGVVKESLPVSFEFVLGYTSTSSDRVMPLSLAKEMCRSIEPYMKLAMEGEYLIASAGIASLTAGIGADVGMKGSMEVCVEADMTAREPDLTQVVSVSASISSFSELRAFVRGKADFIIGAGSIEAGLRGTFEKTLIQCQRYGASLKGGFSFMDDCNVNNEWSLGADVYAKHEISFVGRWNSHLSQSDEWSYQLIKTKVHLPGVMDLFRSF